MRIKTLIDTLDNYRLLSSLEDFTVEGISCNSQEAGDNFVFVAIKGTHADGHKFIAEAINKGAKAVVIQHGEYRVAGSERIPFIEVKDTRQALAKLAAQFYNHPSKKIKVIGITGTNGKTTVSYLLEVILKAAGFSAGVIGTVNYRFKDKVIPAKNTTPGPLELQAMLADMLKEDTAYTIMEVSSHALNQQRTEGINFYSAIFTNLTQDHLDYHQTQENYFRAKAKLFKDMHSGTFTVINNDDKYGQRLKELTSAEIITYGIDNLADIVAKDIKFTLSHTKFVLATEKESLLLKTLLIGRHNIYNILAAFAFAFKEGLDLAIIKSALEKFSYVPGRLEKIDAGNFTVFVDYAHTEDALKNVLVSLRQIFSGRIIVVFGCGGERDKTKRPKMGHVVSELADYAIITSDNPRSEEPEAIIEEIKKGISKTNFCVLPDRREAIKKSLSLAKNGDIVLVAGKGHESYQILKDKIIPFDDRQVISECLMSR
jgi:UDP-N-acetylmuramoyl-L-alanyl-D-glutamate--2,6-diaminopimelate ligase